MYIIARSLSREASPDGEHTKLFIQYLEGGAVVRPCLVLTLLSEWLSVEALPDVKTNALPDGTYTYLVIQYLKGGLAVRPCLVWT